MQYFPQNYMLTKCLRRKKLELSFRVAPISICGPWAEATNAKNAGVSAAFPSLTTLDVWNAI